MAADAFLYYDKISGEYRNRTIEAVDIKSLEAARNHGFFINKEGHFMFWVGWSAPKANGKRNRPYFRRYAKTPYAAVNESKKERQRSKESSKHKLAKRCFKEAAEFCVENGLAITWGFNSPDVSPIPLKGNLLRGVETIEHEYSYATAFQKDYRFDIALLGPKIKTKPIVLGAIEIENSSRFDIEKAVVCKTLGFPLVSIDITETAEDDITTEWAIHTLTQTTNNPSKRRKNYFYIHLSLYPIYLAARYTIHRDKKHQYVVFASYDDLRRIKSHIEVLAQCLGVTNQLNVMIRKNANEQTAIEFKNHGEIAGSNWKEYNEEQYLLLTIERNFHEDDSNYFFHLTLAKILNAHYETLVGYKPYKRAMSSSGNRVWSEMCLDSNHKPTNTKTIPKSLSEPMKPLIAFLEYKEQESG